MFLRTEEKKRESARPKDTPPVTPIDAHSASLPPAPAAPTASAEPAAKTEAAATVEEAPSAVAAPPVESAHEADEGVGVSKTAESGEQAKDPQVRESERRIRQNWANCWEETAGASRRRDADEREP